MFLWPPASVECQSPTLPDRASQLASTLRWRTSSSSPAVAGQALWFYLACTSPHNPASVYRGLFMIMYCTIASVRAQPKKAPGQRETLWPGVVWQTRIGLRSHRLSGSTLGAAAFHGLVRDGSAWVHCAPDTRLPLALFPIRPRTAYLHPSSAIPTQLHRPPALTRGDRQALGLLARSALPLAGPPQPASLPVISRVPLAVYAAWRTHLAAGFPLRCFQRFSLPDVATQHCRTPHNWSTSGLSKPVLSY